MPLFRDTPVLNDRLSSKLRDKSVFATNNTISHKVFPGGHLTIVGSNSPAQLASRPIRFLMIDEVDRFPASAGQEGDPVQLAVKRTTTFRNRKILLTSTPTVKGYSRIESAFNDSDQRYYWVKCPYCGKRQKLVWEQVRWENNDYTTSGYYCIHCDEELTDADRWDALHTRRMESGKALYRYSGFSYLGAL